MLQIEHKNNQNFGEFYARYDGEIAGLMQYEWQNFLTFIIVHTEVESKFEGKGIGKHLLAAAVDFARKEGKKIKASCPFAKSLLEKDETVNNVFIKD